MTLLHLDTLEIADYALLSLRSKQDYASQYGFNLVAIHDRLAKDRPASWSKILLCRHALEFSDSVWWLDADALITNPEIDVRTLCDESADLVISRDASGINAGSFLLRNSEGSKRLLDAAWGRTEFIDHPWWEQAAMAAALAGDPSIRVKHVEQRCLNSYPENWQHGDMVIHFAGKPNRAELFRKYPPFPSETSIDECHAALIYGAMVAKKPRRILELGVGMGYTTKRLKDAIAFNGVGELTCVDNLVDWHGKMPAHFARLEVTIQDEKDFLRGSADNAYDFIASDADHHRAGEWAEEYFRVATDGAFLFFHDTNNADFPGLGRIVDAVKSHGLAHHHFTGSSRPDERCGRGMLWVINQK